MYASGGHISFNSKRNMEKNAAKNQRFLDFPCPIPTTVQKGSASNRLYVSPRCRSHVLHKNFFLPCCMGKALYTFCIFLYPCGPTGRTYTCRRWRQVRDLIIAQNGRTANFLCPPRQRQRGQAHGRFPAEPFPAASKSTKRKSKNHWFLAAFLPTFAAVGKSGSLRRAKCPRARGRGTLSYRCWKKWGRRRQG